MKLNHLLLIFGILLPFFLFLTVNHTLLSKKNDIKSVLLEKPRRIGSDTVYFPFFDKKENTVTYWASKENALKTISLSNPGKTLKKQNTSIGGDTTDILWAPNGIAFAEKNNGGLRVRSLDKEAAYHIDGDIESAAWSPDSKKLLYQNFSDRNATKSSLYIFNRETGSSSLYLELGEPEASFSEGIVLLSWPEEKKILYAQASTDQSLPAWWNTDKEAPENELLSGIRFLELSPDKKNLLTEVEKPGNQQYTVYAVQNMLTGEEAPTDISPQESLCAWKTNTALLCVSAKISSDVVYIGSVNLQDGEYTLHGAVRSEDMDINQNSEYMHIVGNNFFYISSFDQGLYSIKLKNTQ
ncbi:MAG: hypothetical protein HYY51_01465 [Candidatus Magasanikbacteria bacterium]|nr:hypothetical protein [Candidatus Magasanikbacteria bacterium]